MFINGNCPYCNEHFSIENDAESANVIAKVVHNGNSGCGKQFFVEAVIEGRIKNFYVDERISKGAY